MKAYRKLKLRMLIVCAASTGMVLAGMAVVSYHISVGHLQTQFGEIFANNVSAVQSYIREQPVITHTWLLETEQASDLKVGVESDQGYRMYAGLDETRDELTALALQTAAERYGFDALSKPYGNWRGESVDFFMESGQGRYRVSVSRIPTRDDWLTVTLLKDRAGEFRQIASLRLGFTIAAAMATVCLIVFAWLFSAWAIRPAEESRRKQAAFVAAASHEYRSPVAVIQMAAENLEKAPPDVAGQFVKMILRECGWLGRLTQDMLQLVGADHRNLNIRAEQVNPESPVLSTYESFQQLAAAKKIALNLDLPSEPLPKVVCDRERIEQMLAILMDNAIRYAPEGGRITLGVHSWRRHVRFTVTDNGPGIADNQKHRVFERFYRGDASRSEKENYGLGLSIAREIALLHKGKLTVEDAQGGGSIFILSLPA